MNAPTPPPDPSKAKPVLPRFAGLPDLPALVQLMALPNWVVWKYVWKSSEAGGKFDKPPHSADDGKPCGGYDIANLRPYATAAAYAAAHEGYGVGYSLQPGDELTGIDLDDVLDPVTGAPLEPWVAEILSFAETFCETSPSGTGLRLFAAGKLEEGFKETKASVEVYTKTRYLTLTGQHVAGTPTEIRPAPKTIVRCREHIAEFKAAEAKRAAQAAVADAVTSVMGIDRNAEAEAFEAHAAELMKSRDRFDDSFWKNVNAKALANIDAWAPAAFPGGKRHSTGAWRVTSQRLNRRMEEDLSIHSTGIQDFGEEQGKTAIGLLVEHGIQADMVGAAHWLCDRLGISPAAMGWKEVSRPSNGTTPPLGLGNGTAAADGKKEEPESAPTLAHQGVLVHARRDRLELAPDIATGGVFPIEGLPPILRDMVEAVNHHTQAPMSLCAHTVLSACALVTQPLANIFVPIIGGAKPISLFMLAVAVSGERKTSCDLLVSRAITAHEDALIEQSEGKRGLFEAAKNNYAAEVKKLTGDKNLDSDARLRALEALVEPVEPRPEILRASEPTLEGLINILKKGRPSVGIFSSEGGTFIGGHGMTDDAKVRTLTGLSKLWDDGSFDRVRANEKVSLRGKRVSVSLAVQPRIAAALLGDEVARSQGFIGRFLTCFPESTIGTREIRVTDSDGDPRVLAFSERVTRLLREGEKVENTIRPPALYLSDAADEIHRAMAQRIESELTKERLLFPIQPLAQRMAEHIARIAGVLHVFEIGDVSVPVQAETMTSACEIGRFYINEAMRIGDGSVIDPETIAAKDLQAWIEARPSNLISPSIVQQKAPYALRTNAKKTRERILALCVAGILEIAPAQKIDGTPYREVYRIMRRAA